MKATTRKRKPRGTSDKISKSIADELNDRPSPAQEQEKQDNLQRFARPQNLDENDLELLGLAQLGEQQQEEE